MNETLMNGIVVAVGIAIVLTGYIRSGMNIKSRREKFIEKAKAQGHYTTGECVETKIRRGTNEPDDLYQDDSLKVKYQYSVNGVTYTKKMSFESPGMVSIKYPHQVTVYYDPKNPGKAVCKEEAERDPNVGCCGTLVLAGLVMAVLYRILGLV